MDYKSRLLYLFRTFLKVGVTSFGGYAALVAVVHSIMVERDKTIKDDIIVRGFSIASLLPGPVAVNTVTYIGFTVAGWGGALISMLAVILPSMLLMIGLAFFYTQYIALPEIDNILNGVIPVVIAVIVSTAYNLGKKNITSYKHFIILFIVVVLQAIFKGYWVFVLCFLIGGAMGYWFFRETKTSSNKLVSIKYSFLHIIVIVFLVCTITLNFIPGKASNINLDLVKVFSGVSLSLFGGGYVMIPMLNDIVVIQKEWLSNIEFIDAITLGQITPGPILISATFIGFKMNGVLGALIATVSIFLPSSLLMILVSDSFKKVEENAAWRAIFAGLKPVVVALILSSAVIMGRAIENWWISGTILIISSILLIRYKINFLWLIGLGGLIGILLM